MVKDVHLKNSLAIVGMTKHSSWGSCKIITPNLLASYQQAYGKDYNYFGYNEGMTNSEILNVARSIISAKPTRVVILDHMPHPAPLFLAFEALSAVQKLPKIIVHVYGDFTLYTPEWTTITNLLKKMDIEFLCASPRQCNLVRNMLVAPKGVSLCPFPANPKRYFVDLEIRQKFRTELGISDQDYLICYTGRISMQKNIIQMCKEIVELMTSDRGRKIKLILAGSFDDIGAPFFGIYENPGAYFDRWKKWLDSLPSEIQEKILYLGQVDSNRLNAVYNASDLFVSLSTHHDEDFGMSPVEALFCGCPCLLSSWGGYEGFALNSESCVTLSLKLHQGSYRYSKSKFQKECVRLMDIGKHNRDTRSQFYQNKFSINAVARILEKGKNSKKSKFTQWSDTMYKHAFFRHSMKQGIPFFSDHTRKNSFYWEIYKNYCSEEQSI